MRKTLGAFIIGVLVVVGCGRDSPDHTANPEINAMATDEQNVVDRVSRRFQAGDGGLSEAHADCVAAGLVKALSLDRVDKINFAEAVVLPPNEAEVIVTVLAGCTDLKPFYMDLIRTTGAVSNSVVSCLIQTLTEDDVHQVLVASLSGQPTDPSVQKMQSTVASCKLEVAANP